MVYEPPVSTIKSYKDVTASLEDVQFFLETQGLMEEATRLGTLLDTLSCLNVAAA